MVQGVSFANADRIVIRDSTIALPYPSTINVNGMTGAVSKITVNIFGFTHTASSDVSILLVGPQGQSVVLLSEIGGGNPVVSANLTFDDSASSGLQPFNSITSGTYRPTNGQLTNTFSAPAPSGPYSNALSAFNGTNPNGTWSLFVEDEAEQDAGEISSGWSLTVQTEGTTVPTRPLITGSIVRSTGVFQVSIPTVNGANYAVEFTDSLANSNWIVLSTITGDGTLKTVSDPMAGHAQRFYRARVQ